MHLLLLELIKALIDSGNPLFKDGKLWVPHRPERPEKSEGGIPITMKSAYEPAGDQPTAIAGLVEGLDDGLAHQTLLGVTGSGKTFTMANVAMKAGRPRVSATRAATIPTSAIASRAYRALPAMHCRGARPRITTSTKISSRSTTCLRAAAKCSRV